MFIFWGTRRTEEPIETVVEYCPVHRDLHEFQLVAVRMKRHLYGVSLGRGRLAGHEIQTDEPCGHVRAVEATVIASAPAELRHAERLAADKELRERAASLDPAERAAALREAVVHVCTATELEPSDRQINAELKKPALIGGGLTGVLLVAAIAFSSTFLAIAFVATMTVSFGYLVVLSEVVKARARKQALVTAARFGIDPLRPTLAELEVAAAWAKDQGYREVKKLDVAQLVAS